MVHVGWLVLISITWIIATLVALKIQSDDHRATIRALTARNAQDLKLLESPAPAPRRDTRFRPRLPENEGEFRDAPIRPMGL